MIGGLSTGVRPLGPVLPARGGESTGPLASGNASLSSLIVFPLNDLEQSYFF